MADNRFSFRMLLFQFTKMLQEMFVGSIEIDIFVPFAILWRAARVESRVEVVTTIPIRERFRGFLYGREHSPLSFCGTEKEVSSFRSALIRVALPETHLAALIAHGPVLDLSEISLRFCEDAFGSFAIDNTAG